MLQKKLFKIASVFLLLSTTLLSSTRVIDSLEASLLDQRSFGTFQKILLFILVFSSRFQIFSYFLAKCNTKISLFWVSFFSSVLVFRKVFLNLDMSIITFDKVLFIKGDLLAPIYRFFFFFFFFLVVHVDLKFSCMLK